MDSNIKETNHKVRRGPCAANLLPILGILISVPSSLMLALITGFGGDGLPVALLAFGVGLFILLLGRHLLRARIWLNVFDYVVLVGAILIALPAGLCLGIAVKEAANSDSDAKTFFLTGGSAMMLALFHFALTKFRRKCFEWNNEALCRFYFALTKFWRKCFAKFFSKPQTTGHSATEESQITIEASEPGSSEAIEFIEPLHHLLKNEDTTPADRANETARQQDFRPSTLNTPRSINPRIVFATIAVLAIAGYFAWHNFRDSPPEIENRSTSAKGTAQKPPPVTLADGIALYEIHDYKNALIIFEQALVRGEERSKYYIADIVFHPRFSMDHAETQRLVEKIIQADRAYGLWLKGEVAMMGRGFNGVWQTACEAFAESAQLGEPKAMLQYGNFLYARDLIDIRVPASSFSAYTLRQNALENLAHHADPLFDKLYEGFAAALIAANLQHSASIAVNAAPEGNALLSLVGVNFNHESDRLYQEANNFFERYRSAIGEFEAIYWYQNIASRRNANSPQKWKSALEFNRAAQSILEKYRLHYGVSYAFLQHNERIAIGNLKRHGWAAGETRYQQQMEQNQRNIQGWNDAAEDLILR